MKELAKSVDWMLGKFYADEWADVGGVLTNMGAADGMVGLPTANWLFETYTMDEYNTLLENMKNGTVTVDATVLEADAIVNAGLENLSIIYE